MDKLVRAALVVDGAEEVSEGLDEWRGASGVGQAPFYRVDRLPLDGDEVLGGSEDRQSVTGLTVDHHAGPSCRRPRRPRLAPPPPKPVDEAVDGGEAGA